MPPTTDTSNDASQAATVPESGGDYRADEQAERAKLATLRARLRGMLPPATYQLVEDAIEAEGSASLSWAYSATAELARHFPGIAPAIPHVWQHVVEQDLTEIGRCCVVQDPAR